MATRIFQVLILLIACLLVPCLGSALGTTSLGWNTSTTATPISPASTESPAPAPVPFSNMTNCTWGPPADSGSQPGSYPIAYQLVQPDTTSPPFSASNGSYKVQDAWYRAHWVDGPRASPSPPPLCPRGGVKSPLTLREERRWAPRFRATVLSNASSGAIPSRRAARSSHTTVSEVLLKKRAQ